MGLGYLRQLRLLGRRPLRERAACVLAAAVAFGLLPAHASAQETDTGTALTQVAIQDPGSVLKVADMDFGQIAQSNNPGTIVLTPQNAATCNVTGGLIRSGICRAARFSIRGRRNNRVRIREINGGQVTLNGPGGATMSMTNITFATTNMTSVNGANGWNFGNWRIDANSGITEFWLGGTLNVGAAQTPGVYNGAVVIQIQFN